MGDTATAPMPTGGVDDQKAKLDQLTQSIMQRASSPQAGGMRQPTPQFSEQSMTPQGYRTDVQTNKKADIGETVQNIGTFVHNMVAQHKQNQIRDAASEWQGFDHALQNAQALAGDPSAPDYQEKVQKMLSQDPWIKANLDPANPKAQKRLKNMYKALNVDLLEGDKDNVHRDGLKRFFQLKSAMEKVKQAGQAVAGHKQQQQQPPMDPQQHQQMFQQGISKLMGQQTIHPPDMKNIESAARIQEGAARIEESKQAHDDNLELRKQIHLDRLDQDKQNLELRRDQLEQSMEGKRDNLQERVRHDKEMEDLRRQGLQIEAERNSILGDADAIKKQVERGFPIDKLEPKMRGQVLKLFQAEGTRAPVPFNNAEQAQMDTIDEQISKIGTWKSLLEPKKNDNKPFGSFWDAMKYKLGYNTPDSAMISDFSRERWAAVGGLVKGVRRGDILRDMVAHTPDPWKDSSALAFTKLNTLEANYKLGRAITLKEHGYTADPLTGNNIDDDIKSYEDHLKVAKEDVKRVQEREKKAAPDPNKVHSKDDIPD